MKKFIVETYYTCTFKTVHTLNNLNDKELSKIDKRTDGEVELIDVKLNNEKLKIGEKNNQKQESSKLAPQISENLGKELTVSKNKINTEESSLSKTKNKARFKYQKKKGLYKSTNRRPQGLSALANMMMGK